MKRPPKPLIAAAVLLIAGLAYVAYRVIAGGSDQDTILVTGTVEATEADLGFQLSGKVERVGVREGDHVGPGTELASLERSELLAERDAARARVEEAGALLSEYVAGSRREEIARARAVLAVATDRRESAKRDVERLRSLAQQSLISKQAFDYKQTELAVSEGEVARASQELQLLLTGTRPERIAGQRAAQAEAQATLQRIEAQLAQTSVRAPFSGTITIRHREPGEAVNAGTPVLTLQNLDDRWVRLYVPGDEVGRLSLGQCASIASDGFADRRYTGEVAYISRIAEFTPRNVQSSKDRVRLVYEVRVRVLGDEAIDLKPGLPGDVTFTAPRAGATSAATCRTPVTLGAR